MQSATYVALSQQTALDHTIDVISNNIANASTPAFKGQSALFKEYLTQGPSGQKVSYVADGGVVRDTRPGAFSHTGNPLDVAIEGDGYLSVDTPDGPRYTRNGHFQIDRNGQVVTAQGYAILSNNNTPLILPRNARTISISSTGALSTETGPVGQIGVSHFDNQQDLDAAADGLYATDATPTPDTTSVLHQGEIEESNVQPIVELTKMMNLQRAYSSAQQIVEGEDNRLRNAIDKLSKVA